MSRFHDEFFRKTEAKHDELVMRCISEKGRLEIIEKSNVQEKILKWVEKSDEGDYEVRFDYETEVICKAPRGEFIIGYADVVFNHSLFNGYSTPEWVFKTVIEAKPELADIGAVVRQVKTYADILKNDPQRRWNIDVSKVVATYSKVSEDAINYLKHEGIQVVQF